MQLSLIRYFVIPLILLTACNEEVFIDRPKPENPPADEPTIDSKPEFTDSLILVSLVYDKESLTLDSEEMVLDAKTTFVNHTPYENMTILYDNYNSSIVRISHTTYYVCPWATSERLPIEVPGLDSEGVPAFYGTVISFAFGTTIIPRQYMAGERAEHDVPIHHQITATVYTTYKTVIAKATIKYYSSSYPSIIEDGWVKVTVSVPVDIRVEWSEITPAE